MVNGLWCEDPYLIKAEVVRHYKTLFSERASIIFCCDRVEKISVDDAILVEKEFTEEEILEAADLVRAIKWFGDNMEISRGCNSSFVTIIPKVTDPIGLGDFRPISLIGFYYKIIAKVLAERIKKVVGKAVGDVQNAFIKGRYILDGVLIANKVVGHMRKIQSKGLIFKVDFEKAYDSLNLRFLIDIMKKMGFGIKWCKWIESCLRSSTVSILVNGSPTDELCLERGVRQVSGLRVNYNKSKLYGVGVKEWEMRDMARWMRCGVEEFPFTYLGLPIGENMRRVGAWNSVVEKFKNRLADWKAKSMVGDELEGLGLEFVSLFMGEVGNGNDIRFWVDIWVGGVRLCDLFMRLYHLDRSKEGRVVEKGKWVDNVWDRWRWAFQENGDFTVKELTKLVEEKTLSVASRLPVREELDKRGIDLDTLLCPSCGDMVESCSHCLVMCNFAMSVWEKNYSWWKIGVVNAFSIEEFFSSNGNANIPSQSSRMWQAVIWTSRYFIWKERNERVFKGKASSLNKIVQDIQLKSFKWIVRRSGKKSEMNWQQWLFNPVRCRV
ncbi:transposon TX1 [Tanacetum coccineum]